ncbi:hypothetical protein [Pedobacter heparinus]|uniref:hypothetical protein n=1 Tax=Pedobacter heparinus TaxID=984 RepID=UPI002930EDCD|nr:hypothetical protein [Pedobacter heparinus]
MEQQESTEKTPTNKEITEQLLQKSREIKEKHKLAQENLKKLTEKIEKHVNNSNEENFPSA